jgi:SAM-dependent methyltransferase
MTLTGLLRRLLVYSPPDPVRFWRARAADEGSCAVMWRNPAYNELADRDQWAVIERFLPERRDAVLDLGCGTGRLSARLAARFRRYVGVDLDTMTAEARRRNPDLAGEYVTATLLDYDYPRESFDLVLSMACLGNACPAADLPFVAGQMVNATRPGGRILLIDAFHRSPLLARICRVSAREAVGLFTGLGTVLDYWGGLHAIPVRLLLAQPRFARFPRLTRFGYRLGEAGRRLAPRLLGDYQVIALTKPPCTSA